MILDNFLCWFFMYTYKIMGFPSGTVTKNESTNAGDAKRCGFDPWVGKTPGVGNGNQLQYSCLEYSKDRREK